jgi:hypothetical protein
MSSVRERVLRKKLLAAAYLGGVSLGGRRKARDVRCDLADI